MTETCANFIFKGSGKIFCFGVCTRTISLKALSPKDQAKRVWGYQQQKEESLVKTIENKVLKSESEEKI